MTGEAHWVNPIWCQARWQNVRSACVNATGTRSLSLAGTPIRRGQASAIAATDKRRPGMSSGSFAPCRAGGSVGNQRRHSSFMPAKSAGSPRMKVMLTIRSSALPLESRMAWILVRHCRVCSWIVVPTMAPDAGSKGPCPDTKIRPPALIACECWGSGARRRSERAAESSWSLLQI